MDISLLKWEQWGILSASGGRDLCDDEQQQLREESAGPAAGHNVVNQIFMREQILFSPALVLLGTILCLTGHLQVQNP